MFFHGAIVRHVDQVVIQDNYLWCITYGGIVRWDTTDMTYVTFNPEEGKDYVAYYTIAIAPDGSVRRPCCASIHFIA